MDSPSSSNLHNNGLVDEPFHNNNHNDEESSQNNDLREAVQFAVLQICQDEDRLAAASPLFSGLSSSSSSPTSIRTSPRAVAALAELTYLYAQTMLAPDVHAFCEHAGRRRITEADVKLVARKNPDGLLTKLQTFAALNERDKSTRDIATTTTTTTMGVPAVAKRRRSRPVLDLQQQQQQPDPRTKDDAVAKNGAGKGGIANSNNYFGANMGDEKSSSSSSSSDDDPDLLELRQSRRAADKRNSGGAVRASDFGILDDSSDDDDDAMMLAMEQRQQTDSNQKTMGALEGAPGKTSSISNQPHQPRRIPRQILQKNDSFFSTDDDDDDDDDDEINGSYLSRSRTNSTVAAKPKPAASKSRIQDMLDIMSTDDDDDDNKND